MNLQEANLTDANLSGASLVGANLNKVTWSNTTCPDGTNSDLDGDTCTGTPVATDVKECRASANEALHPYR